MTDDKQSEVEKLAAAISDTLKELMTSSPTFIEKLVDSGMILLPKKKPRDLEVPECPYCGYTLTFCESRGAVGLGCYNNNCPVTPRGRWFSSREKAVDAWTIKINKRQHPRHLEVWVPMFKHGGGYFNGFNLVAPDPTFEQAMSHGRAYSTNTFVGVAHGFLELPVDVDIHCKE